MIYTNKDTIRVQYQVSHFKPHSRLFNEALNGFELAKGLSRQHILRVSSPTLNVLQTGLFAVIRHPLLFYGVNEVYCDY
jgi:alanine racemase